MSFRKNDCQQLSFNDSFDNLTAREQKALKNSWVSVFADELFPAINEDIFSVLYSDKASRPYTPVNVIVGALIIKELFLFVHGNKRINHGSIEGRVVDACDRLHITRKTPHKFRKTYISTLYDNGVSLEAIRNIVGHEDERTTLKCYCFNRLTKDQTFEKVAEALEKPCEPTVEQNGNKIIAFQDNKKAKNKPKANES